MIDRITIQLRHLTRLLGSKRWIKYFIAIGFLTSSYFSIAQPYPSRLGRFQVDQKKGCAPFTITVTNLLVGDCTAGKPCVMDYEQGKPTTQNLFTYVYTTPGTFTLKVIYQSIGQDDITVTVDPNLQPTFELHACAGDKASIQVVDATYEQYVIDFTNDGTPEYIIPYSNNMITPGYQYAPPPPLPGPYTASVRGRHLNSADNCTAKTQSFTTYASLPAPKINTLTTLDASSLKLDFSTQPNIQYRMEVSVNGSAFQNYQTLFGVNTITATGIKPDVNYYCFRLGAFDPCSNSSTYSNVVCSSVFTATAQSDVNKLAWTTGNLGSVVTFAITRNANNYLSLPSGSSFNDTDIICKTDYCYQITTTYVGGSKSISLSKCVKSFSNKVPTRISDVSSIVNPGGVDLSWSQDPAFTPLNYSIQRSSAGSPFAFYTTTTATKFTDGAYTTEGRFCYQVNYIDKCDNAAPLGITTCPIKLLGTLNKTNVITLVWSSYKGWKNGVKNYALEKYNLQGTLIKTVTVTDTTFVDDVPDPANQYVQYYVKALPNDVLLTTSRSNLTEFIKNANLYYPTAFSPNGDNLNDGFIVSGQFIVKMSLKIFDRWGAVIFATEKNEPWTGLKEGKPMPPSTYIWKADITDLAGRTFSKEGTVALILN